MFDRAEIARTPSQLGSLIRRARRERGISQQELGEITGLRQATLSDVETGKPGTRLDSLLRILAALELEIQVVRRSVSSAADLEDIF